MESFVKFFLTYPYWNVPQERHPHRMIPGTQLFVIFKNTDHTLAKEVMDIWRAVAS